MNPTTRTLFATLVLGLSASAFAGDAIPAQPIGLLDKKNVGNVEQSDFFTVSGRSGNTIIKKLLFTAKVKDLGTKGEQRALFVQNIEARDNVTTYFKTSDAPLKKLATYTVATGTVFDSFLPTTKIVAGSSPKARFAQMFFHVPGRGLFVTEGGGAPKTVRAEKPTDLTTKVIAGAIRLPDYRNNNTDDPELQSRIFFAAKDAKKGREPFLYGGKTTLLKDIYPAAKVGSDPDQFAVLGPENTTQTLYFVAKSPTDNDSYQLWRATLAIVKGKPVYSATIFTTGANALVGKPENLTANDSDLFFTAPTTAGGTPELWHMRATGNNVVTDLEVLTSGGRDPKQLTFVTHHPVNNSITALAFTMLENGVRRYARYSYGSNAVTVLGVADALSNPFNITDAGQEFYFGASFTDGFTYLQKHNLSDNSLEDVICSTPIPGGIGVNYIYNVGEICTVSAEGTGGYVYFVASAYVDGGYKDGVLFKLAANGGPALASPVRTPTQQLVIGAKNLRPVVDNGSPGVFRLYFSAPVSTTANSEFVPVGSTITDFGTKPWVTEEQN